MLGTFEVQITTIFSLLVGNILFGVLPLLTIKAVERFCGAELTRIKWASFLMFFGAGVFLSDSFLVLLPQANRDLAEQKAHISEVSDGQDHSGHHHDGFPIPEFFVLCGFFGTYVLQELIHFVGYKCTSTTRKSSDARVRFCSCAKRHTECSRTYKDARPDQTLFSIDNRLVESCKLSSSAAAVANGPSDMVMPAKSDLLRSSIIAQTIPNYGTLTNIAEPATDSPLPVLSPPVLIAEERRIAAEQQTMIYNQNKVIVSSLLTVTALALQYIFLGITLGLHLSSPVKWCYVLIVCLQNFVLNFSASTILSVGNVDTIYAAFLIAFLSIFSPVGIIIAITKTDTVEEMSNVAKGTITAIVCGALMYSIFYEMLRHKIQGSVTGLMKFAAIIVGACSMAGIQYGISPL